MSRFKRPVVAGLRGNERPQRVTLLVDSDREEYGQTFSPLYTDNWSVDSIREMEERDLAAYRRDGVDTTNLLKIHRMFAELAAYVEMNLNTQSA